MTTLRIAASDAIFYAGFAIARAAYRVETIGRARLGALSGHATILRMKTREWSGWIRGCGCEHPEAEWCADLTGDDSCDCPCHRGESC